MKAQDGVQNMDDNSTKKHNSTQQDPEAQPVAEEDAQEENSDDSLRKIRPTVEAGNTNKPEAGG
jgi:hypothetical protein